VIRPVRRWRVGNLIFVLSGYFLVAPNSVSAVTTSIKFDVAGFQVTRVWSAASLGIPVSSDPACIATATCIDLGGIMFSSDGNTLYAVAAPDRAASALYAVSVTRSATTNEVTGFGGPAVQVFPGTPPPGGGGLDAGLEFRPPGTLFYSYLPANVLGERVGTMEQQYNLSPNPPGVPISIAGFTFSPFRVDPGTGLGALQLNTGTSPALYELSLMPTGGGFFAPVSKTLFVTLPIGSLGNMQYIPSAPLAGDLMYEAYDAGEIHLIDIDPASGLAIDSTTGQPTLGTAHPTDTRFARGFGSNSNAGPFGLEFDPRNNDLFVSTAEGDASIFNSIIQIQGFSNVTTTTTSSSTSTSTSTTQSTTTSTSTSTSTTSSSSTSSSTTSTMPGSTTTTTMPQCLLDVDENGFLETATDIVYIQRHLSGLTTVPQSFRNLDPNDTIPSDDVINAHIDGIQPSLDVDMNGTVQTATDIVYIRRYLSGLTTVPQSFRNLDPNDTIPSDDVINANIDALCPR
jgi:hypothetical protein